MGGGTQRVAVHWDVMRRSVRLAAAPALFGACLLAACAKPAAPGNHEAANRTDANIVAPAPEPADADPGRYRNRRYAFSIAVPPQFIMEPPPANDDGRVFRAGGAEIRVFGSSLAGGRPFAQQIEAAKAGLSGVKTLRPSPITFRARGQAQEGREVQTILARPDDRRLVTLRVTYPPGDRAAMRIADEVIDSLRLVQEAGEARLSYDPRVLAPVASTLAIPPETGTRLAAVKLIPVDRLEKLGEKECRYGQSGQTRLCEASKEAGLAIAADPGPVAAWRARFGATAVNPRDLAAHSGFEVEQGAEGEGVRWTFLNQRSGTLILERMWREGGADDALYREVIGSLRFTE